MAANLDGGQVDEYNETHCLAASVYATTDTCFVCSNWMVAHQKLSPLVKIKRRNIKRHTPNYATPARQCLKMAYFLNSLCVDVRLFFFPFIVFVCDVIFSAFCTFRQPLWLSNVLIFLEPNDKHNSNSIDPH